MKKVLVVISMVFFLMGASHVSEACSGHIYTADIQGSIDDFAANCAVGDTMSVTDVTTGITYNLTGIEQ